MRIDYLIVGQGLAGSIVAWQLMQHERKVLVVDNDIKNSASKVAAGLINPITGQRLVKSTLVDSCLPVAINCYRQLEEHFHRQFYFPVPMLRIFRSKAEIDRYKNRRGDHAYRSYLGESFQAGQSGECINDLLGSFEQHHTGYLDITALLTTLRMYFEAHNAYCATTFNYSDLVLNKDSVHWQAYQADCVIFCEGANAMDNPWFRWLPFQLSKGEILAVKNDQTRPVKILNDGHWLLPAADGALKVGATYEWQWQDDNPGEEAKTLLLDACKRLTGVDKGWTVINHKAGIRPTTKDKNPFIGTHPDQCELTVFNGFGSKGSMLIPYFASRLVDFLLRGEPLPEPVDIKRFESGISMVTLAKRYLSEQIKSGDVVIDATVGNGYDTEFLARCVGPEGKVLGFDIQQQAIARASQRLASLQLKDRVTLYNVDHKHLLDSIGSTLRGNIAAITFNLGYLPGNEKSVKTQTASTISALEQAIQLIKPGGIITVVSYVGHQGGGEEANSVQEFLKQSSGRNLNIKTFSSINIKDKAPALVVVTKKI
ncbi:FAD-dependent oxidoreductase [Kaarinaea lacus]